MSRKKVSRYILLFLLCGLVCVLCSKYFFEEQIKEIIRERISNQVYKNKSILEELVAEISERNDLQNIHISERGQNTIAYKDLDDPLFTKVFNKFHLIMIRNELEQLENPYAVFYVYPYAGLLWDGYSYGFYYSCCNEPIDIYNGKKCDLEFEDEMGFYARYHYKTNQIMENWWYYERTITVIESMKRKF